MRTTLDIDDDVLLAAKELAEAQRSTVGKVLSDLARKALGLSGHPPLGEMAFLCSRPVRESVW